QEIARVAPLPGAMTLADAGLHTLKLRAGDDALVRVFLHLPVPRRVANIGPVAQHTTEEAELPAPRLATLMLRPRRARPAQLVQDHAVRYARVGPVEDQPRGV